MNDRYTRANRGARNSAERVQDVWKGPYLEGGYFDQDGNIRLNLVSRETMSGLAREMAAAYPRLTIHQLRRFFGHGRAVEARLRAIQAGEAEDRWKVVAADFAKLDIAASDAAGKSEPKIPRLFEDFIKCNVRTVRSSKDFLDGFLPHFEALVGFGAREFKER